MLYFTGPPKFTQDKTPGYWMARSVNTPVQIKCSVCGIPRPKITWFKNSQLIKPQVVGARVSKI